MILLDVDDRALQDQLAIVLARAEAPVRAFRRIGAAWEASVDRNFTAGGRPKKWARTGRGDASRLQGTGRLRRSVRSRVLRDGVKVGTGVRHARLHQEGGVIKPRRRRMLSIPVDGTPKSVGQAGAGALFRRYPKRVYATYNERGGAVFIKRRPGDKAGELMFVLRRRVKVAARPFLLAHPEDVATFRRILDGEITGPLR